MILGTHSRIESVGEVTRKSLTRLFAPQPGDICTCGRSFSDCDYWQPILARLRDRGILTPADLLEASPEQTLAFIVDVLESAGRQIYVESTKFPSRLEKLLTLPDVDLYVIHLIRDPRATALSYARKYGSFYRRALKWSGIGQQIDCLMAKNPNRLLKVRYEALSSNPEREMKRIMDFCGEPLELGQLEFRSRTHHNLAGNRFRLSADTAIRTDTAYLEELRPSQWYAASLLCLAALRRYDYPVSRSKMRDRLAQSPQGRT